MSAPARTQSHHDEDVVAERRRLAEIAMGAVFAACALFAVLRFAMQRATGQLTPWWGNAFGALAIAVLYLWFRRAPDARIPIAGHVTAAVATIALVIPSAYGMTSSKWWLSLVAFAMLLMARRREAMFWMVSIAVLMPTLAALEPYIAVANAAGESAVERSAAGFLYVVVLLGVTRAFRREADKRARELADTARSLERSKEVRNRFLAHMSHELRTPLHGVIAMTDLARKGDAEPAVREQIATAQESALVLLGLLNNVLDVTRGEAGAIELDARPFGLDLALNQVLRPQSALAKTKGLTLTAFADPNILAQRVGDRVRVGQIVLNLVSNALKFTSAGSVSLRVLGHGDPDRIVIAVRDTGRGIEPHQLEAIFEPFTQGQPGDAGLQAGAGLGLAIVRELAKQMEGSVRVESEVGKGSTFTVELRLPAAAHHPETLRENLLGLPSSEPPADETRASASFDILACDDDSFGRRILQIILTRMGHRLTVVGDGREAWELLALRSFDLLLTDIEMPEMDGIELTRRVREDEHRTGKQRMPILATTAHVGEEEEHRLLAAGIDIHVPKPFTEAELAKAMSRVRALRVASSA